MKNSYLVIEATSFVDNTCESSGAALYLGPEHRRVIVNASSFRGNSAGVQGAGLYVSPFNYDVTIHGSFFEDNHVIGNGAAIHSAGNSLLILNSLLVNNSGAAEGAVSVDSSESLVVINCTFTDNAAVAADGGALGAYNTAYVLLRGSSFFGNQAATSGGAVWGDSNDEFLLENTTMVGNVAQNSGGGIKVVRAKRMHVDSCSFRNNSSPQGGALLIQGVDQANFTHSSFLENKALSGHGSALHITISAAAVLGNVFSGNKCVTGAGAVFWKHENGNMREPTGLVDMNRYLENTASYGTDYSTEGVFLVMNEVIIDVFDYDVPVPSFEVALVDFYGQVVTTENRLPTSISTAEDVNGTTSCYDGIGVVSGGRICFCKYIVDGYLNFRGDYSLLSSCM
jgi:hypothetical protein